MTQPAVYAQQQDCGPGSPPHTCSSGSEDSGSVQVGIGCLYIRVNSRVFELNWIKLRHAKSDGILQQVSTSSVQLAYRRNKHTKRE